MDGPAVPVVQGFASVHEPRLREQADEHDDREGEHLADLRERKPAGAAPA